MPTCAAPTPPLPPTAPLLQVLELPDAGKDELQAAWKQWMQEAVAETGAIPPGNAPGQTLWQQRRWVGASVQGRLRAAVRGWRSTGGRAARRARRQHASAARAFDLRI